MPPSPHSKAKKRSAVGRALGGLTFACGTALLVLLLVLQAVLLYRGSFRIPDEALTRIHEELEKRGFEATWRSIDFRPPGTIVVKELVLIRLHDGEPLAKAYAGEISFSPGKLLRGEGEIEQIALHGATVFCPARLSPTGTREPVVDRIHAVAAQSEDGWVVQHSSGRFQNVRVSATGTIPDLPKREEPPPDWNKLLDTWLPQAIHQRHAFRQFEHPHLRLRFEPDGPASLAIEAEVWADAASTTASAPLFGSGELRVVEPIITVEGGYDGQGWHGRKLTFRARSVEWDGLLTARFLTGDAHWEETETSNGFALPRHVAVSLAEIDSIAGSVQDLTATLRRETATGGALEFFVLTGDAPLEGKGNVDWERGNATLELAARIDPKPFLETDFARGLGLNREISFGAAPIAHASATFEDWRFVQAAGRAHARAANIDGVPMDRASAMAELYPDRFVVPEMVLAYDDFETLGQYEIDFASRAYRLMFKGSVQPLHIRPWFRDWWVRLWEDFDFSAEPLRGDVDIHATLGEADDVRLFGSVGAANFALAGVPFRNVDTKLFVLGRSAHLFDMNIEREEGAATGWLTYRADPESGRFSEVGFSVDSTVDPTEVAGVFGAAGKELLSPFRFSEAPALSLWGTIHESSRSGETRIGLRGEAVAPLEFRGLPLERLKVEATIGSDRWELTELTAGFADGEIAGHANRRREEEEDRLGFTLHARDIDLEHGMQALARWQAEGGQTENEVTSPPKLKGRLDVVIDAAGAYGDFRSFVGEGNAQVREADLAEVHLLGILSRILSATPLGFTSLQFHEADAQFRLELDRLHFHHLRLTGPTSAIRAAGDYHIEQQELDIALRVYLLKEARIPLLSLLLSPVLEPLAHMLEIRLSGPVSDPQWRFLLGPRNILRVISSGEVGEEALAEP